MYSPAISSNSPHGIILSHVSEPKTPAPNETHFCGCGCLDKLASIRNSAVKSENMASSKEPQSNDDASFLKKYYARKEADAKLGIQTLEYMFIGNERR